MTDRIIELEKQHGEVERLRKDAARHHRICEMATLDRLAAFDDYHVSGLPIRSTTEFDKIADATDPYQV